MSNSKQTQINEYLSETIDSEHYPDPKGFLSILAEQMPDSEIKPFIREQIYLGSYSRKQRKYLSAILAAL